MSELYTKIWKQAHQEIYSFIKMTKMKAENYTFEDYFNYIVEKNNIKVMPHHFENDLMKAENYTFEDYFNYIVEKNNIKVMPHHFENDLILGITMIDKLGTSISYESSNIETRQNFTKCHELGHLVLKHNGGVFTELQKNHTPIEIEADFFASIIMAPDIVLLYKILYQQASYRQLNGGVFTELQKNHTPIEIEADFFASIIMAPDIVLLYKILYQQASYRQLIQDLKISNQALTIRLSYFLQTYSTKTKNDIHEIIDNYKRLTNSKNLIIDLLIESKDFIIRNYQNILVDEAELIDYYTDNFDFFTNQDLPILSEKRIQKYIKQKHSKISTWAYYDKGNTIWYAWNTTKLSQEKAFKMVKSLHLLKQIKTSNRIKGFYH